jgi:2-polyprenyl-3-methyl-5-hydroxy-6-metoxy-1,4-benzoquinol methylase
MVPLPDEESAAKLNQVFYDRELPGRTDYWRKMAAPRLRVQTFLRLIGGENAQSVADLGCGNGQLLSEIHARLPMLELAGVDLSPVRIADNGRKMPWARWMTENLDVAVRFPDELTSHFDVVIASEIVEHLDRPERILENARALARPGGALLLSTQSGPVRETERRVGHRRHFSTEEMRRLLERAGWRVDRVWNCGFPFHDLSKWYANLRPQASMDRFAARPYGLSENAICAALRVAFRFNSATRGAQLFAVGRRL